MVLSELSILARVRKFLRLDKCKIVTLDGVLGPIWGRPSDPASSNFVPVDSSNACNAKMWNSQKSLFLKDSVSERIKSTFLTCVVIIGNML